MSEDVLPGNPVSIMGRRVKGGRPSNAEILQFNSATGLWENTTLPPGTPHDLLDGVVDQDTVASPVVKGGLIFGNATPKWDQLPRAAADGAILYQNSQLPAWLAAAANGHILNISGGLPAWLNLTGAGYVKGGNPLALQTGIPLADLLNAGGANGDILYWNGANWVRLAIGAANDFLRVSGGLPSWQTVGVGGSMMLGSTFASNFAGITRYGAIFGYNTMDAVTTTVATRFNKAATVTRLTAGVVSAQTGGNTVLKIRNVTTATDLGSVTFATGVTGVADSGAIAGVINAGDLICFVIDATAASGGSFSGSIQAFLEL